ncbi:MAG: methyltransferase domain-containing protein [Deltaproteobacteria bacterium]|nr:methyltransferase domain-containing protein [Deltaproteobacteria bacterium]
MHKHKFDPAHIDRLLRPDRFTGLSSSDILMGAGLKAGDAIADIGCGLGYFTFPASVIVGNRGKVYAVDTEARMLDELKKRNPPPNVAVLKSNENDIPIDDNAVDVALIAYVLHETEDPLAFLKEVRRILKPEGRLLMLDWKRKDEESGPPKKERLSKAVVMRRVRDAGFLRPRLSSLTRSHYRLTARK